LWILIKNRFYQIFVIGVFAILAHGAFGQAFNPYQHAYQGWNGEKIRKASFIRAFLNNFSVNSSLGYGRTFYSHIVQADVLETPEKLVMLGEYTLNGNNVAYSGVVDWLNAPTIVDGNATIGATSGNNMLYTDSAQIKYGGSGFNIPLSLSLQLDVDRFRIGGGIMYEMHKIRELQPKSQGIYPYVPNFKSTFMFRYYFMAGAKVYHIKGWDYNVDFQIGKVKYGNQYDKGALQNGIYFNLGMPFEYELSEYFWIVVRPSFDFKSYSMAITGGNNESTSFQHNQPAFYLNFGVRMKLPEIKRCPVKSCKTQLKHVHGSREFRGQPFYLEQNPKIGELYPQYDDYRRNKRRRKLKD
jgi:hypothetical protein